MLSRLVHSFQLSSFKCYCTILMYCLLSNLYSHATEALVYSLRSGAMKICAIAYMSSLSVLADCHYLRKAILVAPCLDICGWKTFDIQVTFGAYSGQFFDPTILNQKFPPQYAVSSGPSIATVHSKYSAFKIAAPSTGLTLSSLASKQSLLGSIFSSSTGGASKASDSSCATAASDVTSL